MITPSCDEILKLAKEYTTIPVCREIYADMTTPISLLRRLQTRSDRFFLLESVEGGEKRHGNARGYGQQDGQDRQAAHRAPRLEGQSPFTGGFVGYFAYAMLGYAEPTLKIKRGAWDDFDLMLFDKVIAYDHLKQKIVLVVNMKTDSVMENYGKACAALEGMAALINDQTPLPLLKATGRPSFTCNVTEAQYADIVRKPANTSDGDEIMCSSPETLVRLDNGRLTTFPVAGSRPRGKTPEEDKALENELLADEKELSEHNMLVDLGRNDLGRVSKIGTVEVTDYMMIHRYSKIMHICSQVEGDIDEKYDACDAIEAVLPAGTLSGAPKIRACEIIEEQESEPRGVYGGALGYLDFTGNMDTCIAIRMAAKKNGIVTVQAGGGIVADSVPHNEYMESANKAKAVMNAIERASEVDG